MSLFRGSMDFPTVRGEFLNFLRGSGPFVIGYYPDADGLCATAILLRHLLKQGVSRERITLYPVTNGLRTFEPFHFEEIIKKEGGTVLGIGFGINQSDQVSEMLRHSLKLIFIDHHEVLPELAALSSLYINPLFFSENVDPQKLNTTKLMNGLLYDGSSDWLELIALEGDMVIQSVHDSPIYEAAARLNQLGVIRLTDRDVEEEMARRNGLIELLLTSDSPRELLDRLQKNFQLMGLYESLKGDVGENLKVIRSLPPYVTVGPHQVFLHPIFSSHRFELAEPILKAHYWELKKNETVVIFQTSGERLTFRIYTSSSPLDCGAIARPFGGGGHRTRGGATWIQESSIRESSAAPKMIHAVMEEIKLALGER